MSALLDKAAQGVQARLQRLSARPEGLTVRELIDRRMAVYAGRDQAIIQRLDTWRTLIGEFTLDRVDGDVMRAARDELRQMPALSYKGRDVAGGGIFVSKSRHGVKTPATINRYMAAISGVFTWAVEEQLAPRGWLNPCRGIRRLPGEKERVRYLSEGELEQLLTECKVSKYPRLYALVLAAICTGARLGELTGLRCGDVDLDRGVARLACTKNGDPRTLVLLPQVVIVLRPFISSDPRRYVFGSPRTHCQTPADIGSAWHAALARAKISDFRFHDLRHCCASYLAQNGADLNTIREVLGHRKLAMAQRYTHLNVLTRRAAMDAALGKIGT